MIYADIRVAAQNEEDLKSFTNLCCIIQGAGDLGAGRTVRVFIDGDGSGRYNFQIRDADNQLRDFPSNNDWPEEATLWLGE
jgi:hypothetical protein